MAWYIVTDSVEVDWEDDFKYKYSHRSRDDFPTAQGEFDRRREAGLPAYLWKCEGEPKLMESHEGGATAKPTEPV